MKISNATIKSKPLDIVIKIQNVDGMEVVKLSDSVGKSQGRQFLNNLILFCRQVI